MLHQAEVLGSHVPGDFTRSSQLSYGVSANHEHLYHAQTSRVSQGTQAIGSLPQGVGIEQRKVTSCHDGTIYRYIAICQYQFNPP